MRSGKSRLRREGRRIRRRVKTEERERKRWWGRGGMERAGKGNRTKW